MRCSILQDQVCSTGMRQHLACLTNDHGIFTAFSLLALCQNLPCLVHSLVGLRLNSWLCPRYSLPASGSAVWIDRLGIAIKVVHIAVHLLLARLYVCWFFGWIA